MTRTIVFIHGNFVSNRCWDAWVARYQSLGYTCVAIPYPGRDKPVDWLKANPDAALLGSLTPADYALAWATRVTADREVRYPCSQRR